MKRSLIYKLAILSCMSSCLMSLAVYAQPGDENVVFEDLPELTNVACGSEIRDYIYMITNTTDEFAEVEDFSIVIHPEDTIQDPAVVTLFEPMCTWDGCCRPQQELEAGESCAIGVRVNPQELDCPTHDLMPDGLIDRELLIELDAGSQRLLTTPIALDVTILGSAEDYALLANRIIIDQDTNTTEVEIQAGQVQVEQNVGAVSSVTDSDDIIFLNDQAELILGLDQANSGAFSDAKMAYDALRTVASTDSGEFCSGPTIDLLGPRVPINPGIYCLVDGDDNDYFSVNGKLVFEGDEDSVFVFVMPSYADLDTDDFIVLEIEETANYQLLSPAGLVNPNNIIWIGADEIIFRAGANMPGSFITKGEITALPVETESTQASGAAMITGRLIALTPCCDMETDVDFSLIELNGNSILKPWDESDL